MSGIIGSAGAKSGILGITELLISPEHSNAGTTNAFYEEGDWNPSFNNMSNRTGRYIKIGNLIQIWGWIYCTGSGSAGNTIGGLPFTTMHNQDGEQNAVGIGSVGWQNQDTNNAWNVYVEYNNTTFYFYKGSNVQTVGSTKSCHFEMRYRINPGFGYGVS